MLLNTCNATTCKTITCSMATCDARMLLSKTLLLGQLPRTFVRKTKSITKCTRMARVERAHTRNEGTTLDPVVRRIGIGTNPAQRI